MIEKNIWLYISCNAIPICPEAIGGSNESCYVFRRHYNFPGWTKGCEHDDQVPAPGPGPEGGVEGGGAGGAPCLRLRLRARRGGGLRHPVNVQPRHL